MSVSYYLFAPGKRLLCSNNMAMQASRGAEVEAEAEDETFGPMPIAKLEVGQFQR